MHITKGQLAIFVGFLAIVLLMVYGSSPSKGRVYNAQYTQPATLYRPDGEPGTVLAEKEWHRDAQTNDFLGNKAYVDISLDPASLSLPPIHSTNSREPITIAFDYAGKNPTGLGARDEFILIHNSIVCTVDVIQCGQATPDDLQNIKLYTQSKYFTIDDMADGPKLNEYGGWLNYKSNGRIEKLFVYHAKVVVNAVAAQNLQLSLHLAVPQGFDTQYLKVSAVQGTVSYMPPTYAFARMAGGKSIIASPQFRDLFTLLLVIVAIIFITRFNKTAEFAEDAPRTFAILLILWGALVFMLGWSGTPYGTLNDLIALGSLILSGGIAMLFEVFVGTVFIALAMLIAWLTAAQLGLSGKTLFMHTGLITMVTMYAFYSYFSRQLD